MPRGESSHGAHTYKMNWKSRYTPLQVGDTVKVVKIINDDNRINIGDIFTIAAITDYFIAVKEMPFVVYKEEIEKVEK